MKRITSGKRQPHERNGVMRAYWGERASRSGKGEQE